MDVPTRATPQAALAAGGREKPRFSGRARCRAGCPIIEQQKNGPQKKGSSPN
jgi:hypothetical protein